MGGGHLVAEPGGPKIWFSLNSLLRGSVADGLRGALNPAGHIKLFHRPAAIYWRRRGFNVLEFSYDWRLSFDEAAARLRDAVAAVPAGQRVLIAAHSMGGCVACRFSTLYPVEARRVEHSYFFGVPILGTFSAVEVLLCQFFLPRLVARASIFRGRKQVLTDLGNACAAMPGLADLMPDPARYASASILFDRRNWPPHCAPEQQVLDRALALKREMPASPILDRTTVLASEAYATPAGVKLVDGQVQLSGETAPGDGVTLFSSAAPLPELPVQRLRLPHGVLLFEPSGLRAVKAS